MAIANVQGRAHSGEHPEHDGSEQIEYRNAKAKFPLHRGHHRRDHRPQTKRKHAQSGFHEPYQGKVLRHPVWVQMTEQKGRLSGIGNAEHIDEAIQISFGQQMKMCQGWNKMQDKAAILFSGGVGDEVG